ncbi:alpha/beta hydrolase [Pseudooceanicola nanhaiensis]|uniref:alpha/beta hydrolase n=1 Tax=Pseudooceanicola nanhaiensis TaxID=375761 RepID=UPI003514C5B1
MARTTTRGSSWTRRAALALLMLAAACSPRPGPEALNPAATPPDPARVHRIYVVTTRAARDAFRSEPSFVTRYGFYDVSVPPDHGGTKLTFDPVSPDPAKDYFVSDSGLMEREAFYRAVSRNRAQEPGVFVHGFNTSHSEGVFRLAQLTASAGYTGAPILFSWPSEGSPLDYVGDRQGALFSRDPLAELMTELTRRNRDNIVVFGHSMGGFLIVEALRTLSLSGRRGVLDRLETVLASPDIDVALFARTMRAIGPLRNPVAVLTAPGDRALAISSTISGGRVRLGSLGVTDPRVADVATLGNVELVDMSAVATDDRFGHDRYIHLAGQFSRLQSASGTRTGLRGAGAYVLRSLDDAFLEPVFDQIDIQ